MTETMMPPPRLVEKTAAARGRRRNRPWPTSAMVLLPV